MAAAAAAAAADRDEPATPAARFFIQPRVQTVIHAILTVANPIDVEALKEELEATFIDSNPRFSSILVIGKDGREHWRKLPRVDMDDHVVEVDDNHGSSRDFVNEYVASLTVSSPLPAGKPLWEIHVLPRHRCYVLRLHHALGDGISLMSLFLSGCRRVDDPGLPPTIPSARQKPPRLSLWMLLQVLWYTLLYVVQMLLRGLYLKDAITPITGGEGVELWPRRLEVATFDLADMKLVKNAVGGTINDVLLGIVACGLSKYLKLRSPELRNPVRISGLAMVNIRQHRGLQDVSNMLVDHSKVRWGNQFGIVILPILLHRSDGGNSLEYVRRAKDMMTRKKLSLEAQFSYASGALLMSLFGPHLPTLINYRITTNSTFALSNIVGPLEEVSFAGNPVSTIRVTATSLSQAITMHMVSYKGKADLQILVAKDIIPDSEVLRKCFEDALDDMKKEALISKKKEE